LARRAQASVAAARLPRIALQRLEPTGLDGTVGTSLEIGIQAFEIVVEHLAGVEVRHALLRAPFEHGLFELLLGKPPQALDQRGPDRAFLLCSVAAFACQCAPGAPTAQCGR